MCFAGMMLASDENDMEILPVSEEVKAYEPIIQKYAKEHGIPDYVLLIEAVMMQESGGRGTDPMQCSECNFNTLYPHTPGSITDPEYSINVGIQNLADCLQIAECESPVDSVEMTVPVPVQSSCNIPVTASIRRLIHPLMPAWEKVTALQTGAPCNRDCRRCRIWALTQSSIPIRAWVTVLGWEPALRRKGGSMTQFPFGKDRWHNQCSH